MWGLQDVVDELSSQLGRSVVVDDPDVEVLAASAQTGSIDRARSDAILNRKTSPEVVRYVQDLGLDRAVDPVEVPGNPVIESLPRWCFPLRSVKMELAGYLWIVNRPPLKTAELDVIRKHLPGIRDRAVSRFTERRNARQENVGLVKRYIFGGKPQATNDTRLSDILYRDDGARLWCVDIAKADDLRQPATESDVLGVMEELSTSTYSQSLVSAPIDGQLVVIASNGKLEHRPIDLPSTVRRAARRNQLAAVAFGSVSASTSRNRRESLEMSKFTAAVARWDDGEDVRRWEDLGAWTLLKGHEWSSESVQMLSDSAHKLITNDKPFLWLTMLAYLDSCSNVSKTCETLNIQRATLYYRLRRIQELIETNIFRSGWERTSMHIALRLWRAHLRAAERVDFRLCESS